MLRRLTVSALLLAAVVALPRPSAARPSAHAAGMTNVSIALNWIKNVEFAGIWVAQQKGWWRQAGLNVTGRAYDFSNDPDVLVGAGKATFGFQDGASVIIARAQGIPIKAIYASAQQSPFAFITMPTSGIKTVRDFKGKRIGYQAHQKYVLEAMLNHEGLSLKDVQPVVVQFDPVVLLAGKVDAYLAFSTNEPIELALTKGLKVNQIPASRYGYNFYSDVLFTTDSVIKSNPALVRKVVSVMDRGWRYALAHPQETAKIVVPALDKQDTVEQQVGEMTAFGPLSSSSDAPVGSMSAAKWAYGIDLLRKYKQISKSVPTGDVFTAQFLPKSGM